MATEACKRLLWYILWHIRRKREKGDKNKLSFIGPIAFDLRWMAIWTAGGCIHTEDYPYLLLDKRRVKGCCGSYGKLVIKRGQFLLEMGRRNLVKVRIFVQRFKYEE